MIWDYVSFINFLVCYGITRDFCWYWDSYASKGTMHLSECDFKWWIQPNCCLFMTSCQLMLHVSYFCWFISHFLWTVIITNNYLYLNTEWTLYEQVAVAAMDCQCLDVAKVQILSVKFFHFGLLLIFLILYYVQN